MKKIPIASKQIEYVAFDEQTNEMSVHYYTGQIKHYSYLQTEDFPNLMNAENPYDMLVQLTAKASSEQQLY